MLESSKHSVNLSLITGKLREGFVIGDCAECGTARIADGWLRCAMLKKQSVIGTANLRDAFF